MASYKTDSTNTVAEIIGTIHNTQDLRWYLYCIYLTNKFGPASYGNGKQVINIKRAVRRYIAEM